MTIQPYFMEDKSWYKINEQGEAELTEMAPPEAVASYEQYKNNQYQQLNEEANWMEDNLTEEQEKEFALKNLYNL